MMRNIAEPREPTPKAKAKAKSKAAAQPAGYRDEKKDPGGAMDVDENKDENQGEVVMDDITESVAEKRELQGEEPRSKKLKENKDDDMVGIVDTNDLVQEKEEDLSEAAYSNPRGLPPDLVEEGMSEERKRLKSFNVYNVRKRSGWDGVLVDGKWVHYLRRNKES